LNNKLPAVYVIYVIYVLNVRHYVHLIWWGNNYQCA